MFSRPPPPRGAPPSYTFVTKVYQRSLRPIVVGIGIISAVWALIWGVASFRDISVDKDHAARLQVFDIVLGSMYIATCVLELFGVGAAWLQNIMMVRIYSFLSLGAAVIVTAAELMRVVIHFVFKNDLISECTALATGDEITTRFGIWGPSTTTTLSPGDAADFCNNAWSHDSFSEIAWFIVAGIMGFVFSSIAFAYYRQLLDPMSPANQARAPSAQARAATYPTHYNPPYAEGLGSTGASGGYAPPAGPPPGAVSSTSVPEYEPGKLPDYNENDAKSYSEHDDKKGADPFADFEADGSELGHGRGRGVGNV